MMANWNIILLLVAGLLLSSCGPSTTNKEDKQEEAPGQVESETPVQESMPDYRKSDDVRAPITDIKYLVDPIILDGQTTTINLTDFAQDVSQISSISAGPGIECTKSADGKTATINVIGDIGYYEVLTLVINDKSYDVLLEKPSKKLATLRLRDNGYSEVYFLGDMNNWKSPGDKMKLVNGIWEVTFSLAPGAYQYIFSVDGEFMLDPKNPRKARSADGNEVNILLLETSYAEIVPMIKVQDSAPGTIKMEIVNGGVPIVFWQNFKVETTRSGAIFTAKIPKEAKDLANSVLRIYAENEYGAGSSRLYNLAGNKIQ